MKISEPGDPDERLADAAADRVMHAKFHASEGNPIALAAAPVAREPSDPGVRKALGTTGQPLDAVTQAFFEARFGCDFSRVRIHTGVSAERSTRELNAQAYVMGNSVVFAAGRFAPQTSCGRRLLAHELAHVIQQNDRKNRGGLAEIHRSPARPADDQLQQLRAAIEALRAPAASQEPAYEVVAEQHKATLLNLVTLLIELKGQGSDTSEPFRSAVRAATDAAADSRAWNFSGFSMAVAKGLSEALIQTGMAAEGLKLWEAAYGGRLPPYALEHDEAQAQFLFGLLGNLPEPSIDDPQAALQSLIVIQRLYVATAGQLDDPTLLSRERFDPSGPVQSTLRTLLPLMLFRVQAIVSAIVEGRIEDPTEIIDTVTDLVVEVGEQSSVIDSEEIQITMSDFGEQPAHMDFFEPENTGRKIPFEFYTEDSKQHPHELKRPVASILQTVQAQLRLLGEVERMRAGIIEPGNPARAESHPFKDDDSMRAWALQLLKSTEGDTPGKPLERVIKQLERYFSAFTVHADYNLSDRDVRYINRPFPRALTGEVIQDCGIYAMRIAYILSLVAEELDLQFYWVELPVHLALVITGPARLIGKSGDRGRILYAVHNGKFFEIEDHPKASDADIGSWAAATFIPQTLLPDTEREPSGMSQAVPGQTNKEADNSKKRLDVIDVPFNVTRLADVQPDERYQRVLEDAYAALSSEPLAALVRAGIGEVEYLGVIETYRAFAREAPLRFLPAAMVIVDDLISELRFMRNEILTDQQKDEASATQQMVDDSARAISIADEMLEDAFARLAGADALAFSREAQLLRARLQLIPELKRRRPEWAWAETLARKDELPPWYEWHLTVIQLLQNTDTLDAINTLLSIENSYRKAFEELSD